MNFSEFVIFLNDKREMLSSKNLEITFNTIDQDKDGEISLNDMRNTFESGNRKRSDFFWEEFMK